MWIAYTPPTDPMVSISDGTFVGDSDGSELFNGQPRDVSRAQWPSGTMTTSTTIAVQATFPSMPLPAVGAFLGLSLPAGTKVVIKARADGNSATGRTILRSDGTVGLVWYFAKVAHWPTIEPADDINITGIKITIYNDVNGSASIAASSFSDLGEVFISPADYIPLQRAISSAVVSRTNRTAIDGTFLKDPRYQARARAETYPIKTIGFDALSNDPDSLRSILYKAEDADRVLLVPRWHADRINLNPAGGNANEAVINSAAIYGKVTELAPINMTEDIALETSISVAEVA